MPRSRLSLVLLVLAALLGTVSDARSEAEVYRARHRPAEELLPIAEAAMAGEGSAAVDASTNALVLVGPREALARAIALLEEQDRRIPTVLLRYEWQRSSELEAAGVRVAWSAEAGDLRVGNVLGRGTGAAARVTGESAEAESRLGGLLRVLSGQSGRIESGTSLPVTVGDRWQRSTVYVDAASGVEVRPRVLGDGRVQLDINPFDARPGPGGSIQHAGAATQVVVEPGQTLALAGLDRSAEARGAGVSGAASAKASEERVLVVTVSVE